MIPLKIENKIKEKCEGDTKKFELIMTLLKIEETGKNKSITCKTEIEKYYKEIENNED